MKTLVILLMSLGLALADPISKQTVSADNNQAPSLNCSESETKHNEETNSNKGDSEQKNQVNENVVSIDVVEEQIPNEVLIEEALELQADLASQDGAEADIALEEQDDSMTDVIYPDEMRNADEIMETAAGFVPIPIRRRQKPNRRFATRRHFVRNPYRRFYFTYPYYYRYYRPSSLRFY